MKPKNPCPGEERWLALYGGELDPRESERLASHLKSCGRCRNSYDDLCRLGAGIHGHMAARPVLKAAHPFRRGAVLSTAAAALVLAAVGFWLLPGSEPNAPEMARRSGFPRRPTPDQSDTPVSRTKGAPQAREAEQAVAKKTPAPAPVMVEPEPKTPVPEPPRSRPLPSAPTRPAKTVPFAEQKTSPAPKPVVASVPNPTASPASEPTRATEALTAIGTIEAVRGEVLVGSGENTRRVRKNVPLFQGLRVETRGSRGQGVLRLSDGTRLTLGARSVIETIADRRGARGIGTDIRLTRGLLQVEAAPQEQGRALLVSTPYGEAQVVGTIFRLHVDPAKAKSTRLDVIEGKVRLTDSGGRSALVLAGHVGVAGADGPLVVRADPRAVAGIVLQATFEDGRRPKLFETGRVDRGPERKGNRFVLAGEALAKGTAGTQISINAGGRKLFDFAEDLVVAFDVWGDARVESFDVQLWTRTRKTTFGLSFRNTERETWTRVILPLPEFVRDDGRGRILHLDRGDEVNTLWVQSGQKGGQIYIDNLEIVRVRRVAPGSLRRPR